MKMPGAISAVLAWPPVRKVTAFFKRKWVRRTAIAFAAVFVLLAGVVYWNTRPLPGPMGEVILPNEDVVIAKLVAASMALATQDHDEHLQSEGDNTWRRDVHGKTAGCIRAKFTVLQNPQQLSYGLFGAPGTRDAIIRFSNGNHQIKPDPSVDVRGFALKIFDVPGAKLLDGEENDTTQDFILMNSKTYFFHDVNVYAQFSGMLTRGAQDPHFKFLGTAAPSGVLGRDTYPFFRYSWNPANWNIRSFLGAAKAQIPPNASPLHMNYYSASAYKLGPYYAKYSVQPCANNPNKARVQKPTTANGLHDNLVTVLKAGNGGWCADFMVQLQGPNMPVEDPSVEWNEKVSPFLKVARIDIPEQDVPGTQCWCENMAYNPWHSLPAHRPVGIFNRIRKAVYQEGARFRREHQGAPLTEPGSIAEAMSTSCPAPPAAPKVTASTTAKTGGTP